MAKVNPFNYARPIESRDSFVFTDPRYPDAPVAMTFRSPDAVDFTAIQSKAREFLHFYSDKPFPAVDGRIVEINSALAETVASIFVLHESPDPYTMEEIVAFAVTMPSVFADMGAAITELTMKSDLGKLIGVRQSPAQSFGGSSDIPSSTQE